MQRDALAVRSLRGSAASRSRDSPRRSAATRFRRQIATGFPGRHPGARGGTPAHTAGRRCARECRENVRLPVEHVGVGVLALRDQPNIFGDVGVRRTGPLAIDDFVKVRRVTNIARFHCPTRPPSWPARRASIGPAFRQGGTSRQQCVATRVCRRPMSSPTKADKGEATAGADNKEGSEGAETNRAHTA